MSVIEAGSELTARCSCGSKAVIQLPPSWFMVGALLLVGFASGLVVGLVLGALG
jgi:hypothetical protein